MVRAVAVRAVGDQLRLSSSDPSTLLRSLLRPVAAKGMDIALARLPNFAMESGDNPSLSSAPESLSSKVCVGATRSPPCQLKA
jgi:hypothetical protein